MSDSEVRLRARFVYIPKQPILDRFQVSVFPLPDIFIKLYSKNAEIDKLISIMMKFWNIYEIHFWNKLGSIHDSSKKNEKLKSFLGFLLKI